MPTKPRITTLTGTSVDILNAIRNSATTDYRNYVPVATADAESIREIGAIIMDYPALQNEFLNALVNRIGRVIITNKTYTNPWAAFKKGYLEFGETVEEIFVNIAKPHQYNAEVAETEVFKREIPDVRAAFHVMNYKTFYKATVQNNDLRQAFLSWDGVTTLIAGIVDSMYTAANYDEFQVMKYLVARRLLNGQMHPATIPEVNGENIRSVVGVIKGTSNMLEFMSNEYNAAGVATYTMKDRQHLILNAQFEATMGVDVLATSFNMSEAQFMGRRTLIDGFGKLDTERLGVLFANDPTYIEISQDELNALDLIPAVLVDEDWFQIYDNTIMFTENYNGQGVYWQYFYHVWKTFSTSPFANAVAFIPALPSVTEITLTPSEASVAAGQSITLVANVTTENFAPKTVVWSSNSDKATVNASGVVTLAADASGVIEITATSAYDTNVKAVCTITVL